MLASALPKSVQKFLNSLARRNHCGKCDEVEIGDNLRIVHQPYGLFTRSGRRIPFYKKTYPGETYAPAHTKIVLPRSSDDEEINQVVLSIMLDQI